jgi:hypothetical protein
VSRAFPEPAERSREGTGGDLARRVAAAATSPVVVAVGLGALAIVPALVWIGLDAAIWPWDPSWYGQVSFDLWASFRSDPGSWVRELGKAFGSKAPWIAWFGEFFVPLTRIGTSGTDALTVSIALVQGTSVALVYLAVRRLTRSPLAAVAAALFLAAAPLFFELSHLYFVEPWQGLAISWTLLVLAYARDWTLPVVVLELVAAASLGLLAKTSSPAYLGAPVLTALVLAAKSAPRRLRWRVIVPNAVLAAALGAGAVGWYAKNGHAALAFARAAAGSDLYGHRAPFLSKLEGWLRLLERAALVPHLLWLLAALLATGLVLGANRLQRLRAVAPAVGACLAGVAIVLAIASREANEGDRYLMPLLPMLAVLLACGLYAAGVSAVTGATAAVLAVELAVVTVQGLGVARAPLVASGVLLPPRTQPFARTLDYVVETTCTEATNGRINMVGVDYPWLNANTLSMLASERFARLGRRCSYTPIGYAERSADRAWERVRAFAPPYFVAVDFGNEQNPLPPEQARGVRPDDPFNVVDRQVVRRVRTSSGFAVVPGTERSGVVVFAARGRP